MTVKPIFLPIPPDVRGENFTVLHILPKFIAITLFHWALLKVLLLILIEKHFKYFLIQCPNLCHRCGYCCKFKFVQINVRDMLTLNNVQQNDFPLYRNDLKHPSVWVPVVDQPLLCHPSNSFPLTATAALFLVEVRRIHRLTHINRGNLDVLLFYLATH
uniref:Uncharacterized protein n=1 Tax=Glossina pallidipes TaxID=7398 RepID=A0A1B0ABX9_GLOPL